MNHTNAEHHQCSIIQIAVLHLPEHLTEIGREGGTIVSAQLCSEIHLYRLWECGCIERSVNHSEWVEYLPFPPKRQESETENTEK